MNALISLSLNIFLKKNPRQLWQYKNNLYFHFCVYVYVFSVSNSEYFTFQTSGTIKEKLLRMKGEL